MILRRTLYSLLLVTALECEQGPAGGVRDVIVTSVDTLFTSENTELGRPSELAIGQDGRVYIADAGQDVVHVMDTSGVLSGRIGRAGAGPGEFLAPRSLLVDSDTLRLVDAGNGRIAEFSTAGAFIRVRGAEGLRSGAVSLGSDGSGLVALGGRDGALARRFDSSGTPGAYLGKPVVPAPEIWDFGAIKSEIREGRVPAALRNATIPVLAPDGSSWLLLTAEGIIERYNATDSLLWRSQIEEPEFVAILDSFYVSNRADSAANRLRGLYYFQSAQPSGADLWVMVMQPASASTLILVLGPDGQVRERVHVPSAVGVRGFALDPQRKLLYLLAYYDGVILRCRIP